MSFRNRSRFLLGFLVIFIAMPVMAKDRLTNEEIATLQQLIKPTQKELKWTTIPWMLKLWDARVKAAKVGKPIFLWQMDGNPLGCV